MANKIHFETNRFNAFFLLFIIIGIIYSNSLTASWHLDDEPNIIQNNGIKINQLSFGSLQKSLYAHPIVNDQIYRPVAMLTFALNWWVGKNTVIGYHAVNILIHLVCAFLLFLTINTLFKSPRIKGRYDDSSYFLALLSAVFWAINPIQTQAVTYIIQRMASLSTLFFLWALYLYLKARIDNYLKRVWWLYFLSFFSYLLAVGSKENAAIFPLSLLLIEAVFFQDLSIENTRKKFSGFCLGIFLLVGLIVTVIFIGDVSSLLKGYEGRSFTLTQRLLTEPRILIYYLSLIFYPVADRLSIEHDIVTSTSLIHPWSTLPAIFLICVLIIWGLLKIRQHPFTSFGILFFFLNHSVESTFIPLELIFEHRNYLPSLFLFVPISIGLKQLLDYYREKRKTMAVIICSFITLLIVFMGVGTFQRNMVWATEWTLWRDAASKAPKRARPLYVLANLYLKRGAYDQAMRFYQKASHYQSSTPDYTKALVLNGMAAVYFAKGDYEKCIAAFQEAMAIKPDFNQFQYNKVIALIKLARLSEANQEVEHLLKRQPDSGMYLYLKGLILKRQGDPMSALPYFRKAMLLEPDAKVAKIEIAESLVAIGEYRQAEVFIKVSQPDFISDMDTLVFFFANSLKSNRMQQAETYLSQLLDGNNLETVLVALGKKTKREFGKLGSCQDYQRTY